MPAILLLDCSTALAERLKSQGFDVESGTVGYCNGIRELPSQIYEKDIFIYDPAGIKADENGMYIRDHEIENSTPEYELDYLVSHIKREGSLILAFVKPLVTSIEAIREAYSWIPSMPELALTKDFKPEATDLDEEKIGFLAPLISKSYLKTPVQLKMHVEYHPPHNIPLYFNKNYDVLGAYIRPGEGQIILLPDCVSNEEIVSALLHRVIPKLLGQESRVKIINQFQSPGERKAIKKIKKAEGEIQEKEKLLEEIKQDFATATRNKIQIVQQDDTAVLVQNYYDLALSQEDVSLFYLYKVTEAIKKKYGSKKKAVADLDCSSEWNLIGRLANVSYADVRHAPSPGEKIKEWSQEEIKDCFAAAKKIILAYLEKLF